MISSRTEEYSITLARNHQTYAIVSNDDVSKMCTKFASTCSQLPFKATLVHQDSDKTVIRQSHSAVSVQENVITKQLTVIHR